MTDVAFVLSDFLPALVDRMLTHPAEALLFDLGILIVAWKCWRLVGLKITLRRERKAVVVPMPIDERIRQDARDRQIHAAVSPHVPRQAVRR